MELLWEIPIQQNCFKIIFTPLEILLINKIRDGEINFSCNLILKVLHINYRLNTFQGFKRLGIFSYHKIIYNQFIKHIHSYLIQYQIHTC